MARRRHQHGLVRQRIANDNQVAGIVDDSREITLAHAQRRYVHVEEALSVVPVDGARTGVGVAGTFTTLAAPTVSMVIS